MLTSEQRMAARNLYGKMSITDIAKQEAIPRDALTDFFYSEYGESDAFKRIINLGYTPAKKIMQQIKDEYAKRRQ